MAERLGTEGSARTCAAMRHRGDLRITNVGLREPLEITLGLIEAWFDRKTGCALIAPPFFEQDATRLDRFEFRSLDYDECLTLTQASVDLIRRHNPQAKFLITTSPVPLEMSFSGDDILIA